MEMPLWPVSLTAGGLKYNPPPANKTLENFSKITVAGVKSSMRKVSHHNLENLL